jgi:hypothetical protein
VAIHEVAVHPTAGEIVVATHGRSLWCLDVGSLRQMKPDTVKQVAHLYQPHQVIRTRSEPSRGGTVRRYNGENAPAGAQIYFSLNKPAEEVSLKITDAKGDTLQTLRVPKDAGLHKINWNLARTGQLPFAGVFEGLGGGGGGRRGGGGGGAGGGQATTGGAGGQDQAATGARRGNQEGQAGGGRRGGQGGQATAGGGGQGRRGGGGAGGGGATQAVGTAGQGGGGRGGFGGAMVPPGTYVVVLTVDGKEHKQTIQVLADPNLPNGVIFTEEEEEAWEADQRTYRRQLQKNPN